MVKHGRSGRRTVYFCDPLVQERPIQTKSLLKAKLVRARAEYLRAKSWVDAKVLAYQVVERDFWNVVYSCNDSLKMDWKKSLQNAAEVKDCALSELAKATDEYRIAWDEYEHVYFDEPELQCIVPKISDGESGEE